MSEDEKRAWHRSAKDRICDHCHGPIYSGDPYIDIAVRIDGHWKHLKVHNLFCGDPEAVIEL